MPGALGASWRLADTVTDLRVLRVVAVNCVYPSKLPVWPKTVPHFVSYRNSARPAEF